MEVSKGSTERQREQERQREAHGTQVPSSFSYRRQLSSATPNMAHSNAKCGSGSKYDAWSQSEAWAPVRHPIMMGRRLRERCKPRSVRTITNQTVNEWEREREREREREKRDRAETI